MLCVLRTALNLTLLYIAPNDRVRDNKATWKNKADTFSE